MKFNLLTYLFALINLAVFGQNTEARKFDNILAVNEEINGKWKSYYLTKAGKVVGIDSLEIYDNTPVCESEGFICFRDKKTDKAGMFNGNGDIVIPAMYNYLTSVRNGMVIGLKDAKKKYWDKDNHSGCNHFSWEGGKGVLLDTLNNVLVDNFTYDNNLNFFSIEITKTPHSDTTRKSFLAKDGNYYSFVDFEKEFRAWLKSNLLDSFTKENLLNATYREVAYWRKPKGWIHEPKENFIDRNYDLIKAKLLQLNSANSDYNISSEGLNQFIFESEEFKDYFNNCGESKDWIYPVQNVIINYRNNNLSQDHFEFLRTDKGYRLLSVTIRWRDKITAANIQIKRNLPAGRQVKKRSGQMCSAHLSQTVCGRGKPRVVLTRPTERYVRAGNEQYR